MRHSGPIRISLTNKIEEEGVQGEKPSRFSSQAAKDLQDNNAEATEEFTVRIIQRQFGENALMQHGLNQHSRGSSLRSPSLRRSSLLRMTEGISHTDCVQHFGGKNLKVTLSSPDTIPQFRRYMASTRLRRILRLPFSKASAGVRGTSGQKRAGIHRGLSRRR